MSLSFWNPNSVFAGFDDHYFDPLTSTLIGVFAGFDDHYFDPLTSTLIGVSPNLTKFKTDTMCLSSPRYEVTDNDKQFRLAIDVSLRVKVVKTDKSVEEYKFEKRFTLGRDLDTSKITAHLADGVLVLTAPNKEKLPLAKQEIAITQGEAPAMIEQ